MEEKKDFSIERIMHEWTQLHFKSIDELKKQEAKIKSCE